MNHAPAAASFLRRVSFSRRAQQTFWLQTQKFESASEPGTTPLEAHFSDPVFVRRV
jgi:hypothetical protein